MRVRDDIDPANTWVVSDTHFGHDNIVGFCHRPEDHEQIIIAEWRKYVPDDATVLHLGDLVYRSNGFFKHIVSKELTGARKLLIRGNHDRKPHSFYRDAGFQLISPFVLSWGGRPLDFESGADLLADHPKRTWYDGRWWDTRPWSVSFSHYSWDEAKDGPMRPNDVRIHGHIHNNGYTREDYVPFLRNHINVSVEQTGYRPVNLKALLDAALLGLYVETTDESLAVARARKAGER